MAKLIAQSAVQPFVSTILGQIARSAPGAPDFHIIALEDILDSKEACEGITYQVQCSTVQAGGVQAAAAAVHQQQPVRYGESIGMGHSRQLWCK